MLSERVVVVGTTSDYVEHIRSRYPQRALFITDRAERVRASEPDPGPEEEVVAELTDEEAVLQGIMEHLYQRGMTVAGVTCFDCESMVLASAVAQAVSVPFPSPVSIAQCRNKYLSRQRWNEAQVPCPDFSIISNGTDLEAFFKRQDRPIVIKPLSGSGSELVFKCHNETECLEAFQEIQVRLSGHANVRMYRNEAGYPEGSNSHGAVMAEDFIEGKEYSSDFLIDGPNITIIRIAEKARAEGDFFGTTLAYRIPGVLSDGFTSQGLEIVLQKAAHALGIDRAVCMADIMVNNNGIFLLELSPRPGGDCLPPLIRQSCGVDMLELALTVAAGKSVTVPNIKEWTPMVGVRVFAHRAGELKTIDGKSLRKDSRVREWFFNARPGYRIILPPVDYDSRILGHVIFEPQERTPWQRQCFEVLEKIIVEIV